MSIFDSVTSALEQPAVGVSDAAPAAPNAQPSTADAALFLALLQAQLPSAASSSAMADGGAGDTALRTDPAAVAVPLALLPLPSGSQLPLHSIGDGSPVPVSGEALPDDKLEDFAVDLGIDRDLARLLLSQTVPNARNQPSAQSAHSLSAVQIALQASRSENQEVTTSTMLGSWAGVSPTSEGLENPEDASSALDQPVGGVDAGAWLQSMPLVSERPLAVSPPPATQPHPSTQNLVSLSPLPQAFGSDIPEIEIRALPQTVAVAQAPQDPNAIGQQMVGPPLADEDILRWRTASTRAMPAVPAETTDWKNLFSKLRISPEPIATGETAPVPPAAPIPDFGSSAAVTMELTDGSAPITPNPASPQPTNAALPSHQAEASKAEKPIQVPAGDLTYEDRAAAFSQQVGRRIMESIRTDKWEVNIRLDPQHLGPLNIRLDVDGNNIEALFGVNSADVQGLLEQGLPKLRGNFESSGYSLNAWNFSSSNNSHSPPSGDRSTPAALKAEDAPAKRAAVATKTPALAHRAEANAAGAVDLFV